MIKDHNQSQAAGDGSTNLQGQSIVVYQGISYSDAKQIAIDVYQANFMQLSNSAAATASARAEELAEKFLLKIVKEHEASLASMQSPGMQSALYEAQKQYAKTGDKDLEDLLVDILVDRAQVQDRNIAQIVLDEALEVAGRLTLEHLDALTLNFLLTLTFNHGLLSLKALGQYFHHAIMPFAAWGKYSDSCFTYLQYARCGTVMEVNKYKSIETIFRSRYPGLFSKGFTMEEFEGVIGVDDKFKRLLGQSLHFPQRMHFRYIDEKMLLAKAEELSIQNVDKDKISEFFKRSLMEESEVKAYLLTLKPEMDALFNTWNETPISKFQISPVGIAVAIANFSRKTGKKLTLSTWVS